VFTGLIQEKAKVISKRDGQEGFTLMLARPESWHDLKNGESIAADGVCLTLVQNNDHMSFFVGAESVDKTSLSSLKTGDLVNLERSLALGDRLGGHMVSGHIDGTATVTGKRNVGECLWLEVELSSQQFKFVIPKGSIALNGVSLTVNNVNRENHRIEVLLIPETLARTNLGSLTTGTAVNVECDQTVKIIAHQVSQYGAFNEQHS
jgi:riboflavin synthase